jgi:hypothetical protein
MALRPTKSSTWGLKPKRPSSKPVAAAIFGVLIWFGVFEKKGEESESE